MQKDIAATPSQPTIYKKQTTHGCESFQQELEGYDPVFCTWTVQAAD